VIADELLSRIQAASGAEKDYVVAR